MDITLKMFRQKNKLIIGVILLFLIMLTFLPRMLSLSSHWATDEDLWMQRSADFFLALDSRQFEDTFTTHHPGVTTCWLGSLSIWWYTSQQTVFKSWFRSDQFMSPEMLALVRFPIAFLTGVLILLIGFCIFRLFGGLYAVLSIAFLAIEPLLLSESRRAHTDALTALFLFLSLLLWICYLEGKRPHRLDLVFSGVNFGLACLTKSHAGAFLIFLPILLWWYIKQRQMSSKRLYWGTLLWFMAAGLTVQVVWPYMWTRVEFPFLCVVYSVLLLWGWRNVSKETLINLSVTKLVLLFGLLLIVVGCTMSVAAPVINQMQHALTDSHVLPKLFLGALRLNPGWFYFPVMLFVWCGLVSLPFICFLMFSMWKQPQLKLNQTHEHNNKSLTKNKVFRITVVLFLFVLFYLLGLSLVSKKITRYLVIFLPAISLLTVLGAVNVAHLFSKQWYRYVFLIVVFIMQAVPVLHLHPYYRTYYHPVLSGKWVAENSTDITGAGLDLAAAYLNAKPNAEQLQVRRTWFSNIDNYFVGSTIQRNAMDEYVEQNIDYDVEYIRDKQVRDKFPIDAPPDYKIHVLFRKGVTPPRELEHVISLNGIDYVWIYRVIKPEPTDSTETSSE